MTKKEFLYQCRYTQPGAWFGIDLDRVTAVAEREEDRASWNQRPQYFTRKYYRMDDGTILMRLLSGGFDRVEDPDPELLALLEQGTLTERLAPKEMLTPSYKVDNDDGRKAIVVGWDEPGGPIDKFAVDCEDQRFEPTGGFFGDVPEVRPVNGRVTLEGRFVEN